MKYLAYHEYKPRGTFDFPIEFYYIDKSHPRYQMPFHWHMEYELIRVLQGSLQLSLDQTQINLKSGDAVLVQDGTLHGGTPQDCVYECIVFDFNRLLQDCHVLKPEIQSIIDHTIKIQQFFQKENDICRIVDCLFETMKSAKRGYEFIASVILWQMFGLILQQYMYTEQDTKEYKNRIRARKIKDSLLKIHHEYSQALTLSDLSVEANMAPKYFCRVFRQITGKTPIDYLNFYRIECACEELLTTDDTVTDIALRCGFNDLSYFIKSFSHYKNTTPKKYRNMNSAKRKNVQD